MLVFLWAMWRSEQVRANPSCFCFANTKVPLCGPPQKIGVLRNCQACHSNLLLILVFLGVLSQ